MLGSGGTFPVSVAVHGDVVYVLNAENGGNVQGTASVRRPDRPIPGSNRPLGLEPGGHAAVHEHARTGRPSHADGGQLIVTTKANGNDVDVFGVGQLGLPVRHRRSSTRSPARCRSRSASTARDTRRRRGRDRTRSPRSGSHPDGTITQLAAVRDRPGRHLLGRRPSAELFYASNAGSAIGDRLRASGGGQLTLLGNTTHGRARSMRRIADGRFLYVQAGASGIVDEFHVNADGSLTTVGSVTVPGAAGGEGIVAF